MHDKKISITEMSSIALSNLKQGNLREAEKLFQEILKINPEDVNALHFLGVVNHRLKNYEQAISFFNKALRLRPDYFDAHNNLGILLQETGRLDEAIASYEIALKLSPDSHQVYYNLGTLYQKKIQPKTAIDYYYKTLQLNPAYAEAYINLAAVFSDIGEGDLALKCYHQALQLDPNQHEVLNAVGYLLDKQSRIDESESYFRKAISAKPDYAPAYDNLLMNMCYNPKYDMATIFREHKKFGEQFEKPYQHASHSNDCSPERKLRIGYVSPDLRKHSVAYFFEPVIMSHDKENHEVFCYANMPLDDEVTGRLKAHADHWLNIHALSDEEAFDLIRRDGIDILIDLAGHTGHNRLTLFAMKPAPVQASWIGYPSTTGLYSMDYRIVDSYTDPEGITGQFYTEKLVRLPESFLCYMPEQDSPEVTSLPALSTGHVTFASFNKLSKISAGMLHLWARILKAIPDSSLILKSISFSDKSACSYISDILGARGIYSDRFQLIPWVASTKEHLELYHKIDIALDTFPYNGTTTTCEALWMGVPVVTLAGDGYGARVGASLLSNIGLRDLITTTPDGYIEKASALAGNLKRLETLRSSLRDMMAHSPLMDARRFTINLEKAYREMWKAWCWKEVGSKDSRGRGVED